LIRVNYYTNILFYAGLGTTDIRSAYRKETNIGKRAEKKVNREKWMGIESEEQRRNNSEEPTAKTSQ
jgi:hypothetical protein